MYRSRSPVAITAQRFDDRFERLNEFTPIPDAPTFLKGRFKADPATGELRTESDGVHSRTQQAGTIQTMDLRGEDVAAR